MDIYCFFFISLKRIFLQPKMSLKRWNTISWFCVTLMNRPKNHLAVTLDQCLMKRKYRKSGCNLSWITHQDLRVSMLSIVFKTSRSACLRRLTKVIAFYFQNYYRFFLRKMFLLYPCRSFDGDDKCENGSSKR